MGNCCGKTKKVEEQNTYHAALADTHIPSSTYSEPDTLPASDPKVNPEVDLKSDPNTKSKPGKLPRGLPPTPPPTPPPPPPIPAPVIPPRTSSKTSPSLREKLRGRKENESSPQAESTYMEVEDDSKKFGEDHKRPHPIEVSVVEPRSEDHASPVKDESEAPSSSANPLVNELKNLFRKKSSTSDDGEVKNNPKDDSKDFVVTSDEAFSDEQVFQDDFDRFLARARGNNDLTSQSHKADDVEDCTFRFRLNFRFLLGC